MAMKQNTAGPAKARKTHTFRFAAPSAMSVLLVGDFTHWQRGGIPMRKDRNGEWRDDPECKVRVPNPYGTHDMIREAA
jgi:1,4-alpha-glucan branching enzyme